LFSGVQRSDAGVYILRAISQGASPEVSVSTEELITLVVECECVGTCSYGR
jgi:hypothetical protein